MRACGWKPQAVSSRTSRTMAASKVSPCSTCPAGWLNTRRRLIRSSTTRKRPSVSVTAATVISGERAMLRIIAGSRTAAISSASASDSQAVLGCAGVPDRVKFLQIEPGGGGIIGIGDAVPRIRTHAVDDRSIVSDQVCRCTLRGLCRDIADIDAAREASTHCDEAVAVAHDAGGLCEEDTHLRETACENKVFNDLEESRLIVKVRLEVRGVDGNETLRGGGDLIHRGADFGQRCQNTEGLRTLTVRTPRVVSAHGF